MNNETIEKTKTDPLKRYVEKESGEELSPMSPPDAYQPPQIESIPYENLHPLLQLLIDEHKVCLTKLENFENTLLKFKTDEKLNEIDSGLRDFFTFFDNKILIHNTKEEKVLFDVLHKKLVEKGEHSSAPFRKTVCNILEDDHSKFLQLGSVCFNLFGLSARLSDMNSRLIVIDTAIEQGKNLIEALRLHIFREDNIVFALAQKYLTNDEMNIMLDEIKKYEHY